MSISEVAFGDLNYALVKNVGTARATLTWNSTPFIVEPGEIEPVPFEAVANWLGDPRSVELPQTVTVQGGENRYIPSRMDERKRLRQLYGLFDSGDEYEIVQNGRLPQLEVKYRSKRVYTVLEDPDGTHIGAFGTNAHAERQAQNMQDQMAFLEDQLRIMKARFDGGTASPQERDYVNFEENELPDDEAPEPGVPPLARPRAADNFDWSTTQSEETAAPSIAEPAISTEPPARMRRDSEFHNFGSE